MALPLLFSPYILDYNRRALHLVRPSKTFSIYIMQLFAILIWWCLSFGILQEMLATAICSIAQLRLLPEDSFYVTINGKIVDWKMLEEGTPFQLHFRLRGGKGGLLRFLKVSVGRGGMCATLLCTHNRVWFWCHGLATTLCSHTPIYEFFSALRWKPI